ncbi:MAG: twin-arginine translocase TatA/TatE family subunit [Pseudomonadales bacterium]
MSFGIPELILVLVIVLLLFGTTKLKSLGSDLGSAIKGFRNAISPDDDKSKLESDQTENVEGDTKVKDASKIEAGKE